jgi:monovalent cation:H+ antiporter-2, CPA2 family
MGDEIRIFRDIAMVFAGALVGGLLAARLRQPLIIGYVLAGLVLSPLTPGPRIHDVHTFETMAEVGVILLMFSVGMEFSIPDLLRVKWVALLGGPLGILISIALGIGVGALAGWPLGKGIAIGSVIAPASTMVLMRLLMDRGELATTPGRVMIALSLVEDLAVVILTLLLPSLSSMQIAVLTAVAWSIAKALLILVPVILLAWKLIPRMLARFSRWGSPELSLLFALTLCLVTAALTQELGLSLALGAFVAGLLIASLNRAHDMLHRTQALRDAFVALFFVTIGMLINPYTWLRSWRLLLILVVLVLVGKCLIWTGVVRLFRYSWKVAFRAGMGLTQIGEFSFILAQVALHSGLIDADAYSAILAASLITIFCNAAVFRLFELPTEVPEPIAA